MADPISWLEHLHAPKAFGEEVTGSAECFRLRYSPLYPPSNLDRYYGGHTENIELNLVQHNNGISAFTS